MIWLVKGRIAFHTLLMRDDKRQIENKSNLLDITEHRSSDKATDGMLQCAGFETCADLLCTRTISNS